MSKASLINYFSSFGTRVPYVLVDQGNYYQVIKNPLIAPNNTFRPFIDGIYFELLQGDLSNPNNLNQSFVFRLRNPNNVNLSNTYKFRAYDLSNNTIIYETEVSYNCENELISFTSNLSNLVFTIESGSNILYTIHDLVNGYVPLDQRLYGVFYDTNLQELYRSYLFRRSDLKAYILFKNHRTANSIVPLSQTFPIYLAYLFDSENQIGTSGEQITTEFKFPNQYDFVDRNAKKFISGFSIFLLEMFKDFLDNFSDNLIFSSVDQSSLEKFNNRLLYKEYFFNQSTLRYEKLSNVVDVQELILALFYAFPLYNLSRRRTNFYEGIVDYLYNYSSISFYPGTPSFDHNNLVPDYISNNIEEEYSLATNLLFIALLDLMRQNYDNLRNEIINVFISNNRKRISRLTGNVETFTPLEAALIAKLAPRYLDISNDFLQSVIQDANSYLSSILTYVNQIELSSDALSSSYNPIYNLNFSSALPIYDNRIHINLGINFILERNIINFGEFGSDGFILDNLVFDQSNKTFILPSLRALLSYLALSLQNFYTRIQAPNVQEEELIITDYVATSSNSMLFIDVYFNKPVKVLALVLVGNRPFTYAVSNEVSLKHTFVFDFYQIPSNYSVEFYPLK